MRKAILLSSILAFVLNASAVINGNLLQPLTDSISWNSAELQTTVTNYTGGSYTSYYKYQIQGDTVQYTAPQSYAISTIKQRLYGLPPNTSVTVWRVLINAGDTVTASPSSGVTFTTKPYPHAAYISAITFVPSPTQTLCIFNYNASVTTPVYVLYNGYSSTSTAVTVDGTGTDTVIMTSPNTPGTTYNGIELIADPIAAYSGVVNDTSYVPIPNSYTVPNYTAPVPAAITFSNVVQTTYNFSSHITLGNGASAIIYAKDLDSNGIVVGTHAPVTIFSDTTIQWTRTSAAYTNSGEMVIAYSTHGSDTVIGYQRTLAWTLPTLSPVTFSNVTRDSFWYSVAVTLGNVPNTTIRFRDLDSNGNQVGAPAAIAIFSDTTIRRTRTSLPYVNNGEMVIAYTSYGSDTVTGYQRTLQIPAPQAISLDTISTTASGTASLTVTVATNGKPSWPTSAANVWITYTDKNGTLQTLPSAQIPGSADDTTLAFNGLVNLTMNPGTNTAMLHIKNLAGLADSLSFTFYVLAPLPAVPISTGWQLEAASSFQLDVYNVNAGPSVLPYKLYAIWNVHGSGQLDTVLLIPNQIGYTTFAQHDTFGNYAGATNTDVMLATENQDGVWYNTSVQTQQTVPASTPTFYIANDYVVNDTSVTFSVLGCDNGNDEYLWIDLYYQTNPTVSIYSYLVDYEGPGYFSDIDDAIYGLDPCEGYILKAVDQDGNGGNELVQQIAFGTSCLGTGITNLGTSALTVSPNPATDRIMIRYDRPLGSFEIYAGDGREMMTGSSSENESAISVADLAPGIYLLKGEGFAKRFVKE